MSKQSNELFEILKVLFPHNIILSEQYVRYKGQKLFFDFFVKDLGLYLEIQGQQHFEFVKHFHGSIEGFRKQKERDNLKLEYIEKHERFCLVRFNYDEKINKRFVLNRINKAFKSDKNYV